MGILFKDRLLDTFVRLYSFVRLCFVLLILAVALLGLFNIFSIIFMNSMVYQLPLFDANHGLFVFIYFFFCIVFLYVLKQNNPLYILFVLIFTIIFCVIIFFSIGIEILSLLFLIIYVGAIAILFLFVIMLLNIKKVPTLHWQHFFKHFVHTVSIFLNQSFSSNFRVIFWFMLEAIIIPFFRICVFIGFSIIVLFVALHIYLYVLSVYYILIPVPCIMFLNFASSCISLDTFNFWLHYPSFLCKWFDLCNLFYTSFGSSTMVISVSVKHFSLLSGSFVIPILSLYLYLFLFCFFFLFFWLLLFDILPYLSRVLYQTWTPTLNFIDIMFSFYMVFGFCAFYFFFILEVYYNVIVGLSMDVNFVNFYYSLSNLKVASYFLTTNDAAFIFNFFFFESTIFLLSIMLLLLISLVCSISICIS